MECEDCRKEMGIIDSCNFRWIKISDMWYDRNTKYYDVGERCHDCNIENKEGNIHHFSCDMERCPKCASQLISCSCLKQGLGKGVA